MSEFNKHINPIPQGQGDPNWQRLFDDASETPPPRIWDAIERDLDREKDDRVIIVPFWGRSSTWAWSAAAAVALLLLGWWSLRVPVNKPANQSASMATNQPKVNSAEKLEQSNQSKIGKTELAVNATKTNQSLELGTSTGASKRRSTNQTHQTNREPLAAEPTIIPTQSKQLSDLPTQIPTVAANQTNQTNVTGDRINDKQSPQSVPAEVVNSVITEQTEKTVAEKTAESMMAAPNELAMMDSRPVQLPSMYGTQRIVWFNPTKPNTTPTDINSQKSKSERWASVSVMPSSFNPGVGLLAASATYGNAFAKTSSMAYSTSADPTLESQPNLSVAYQVSSGIQVSSRWSVETGVGYLEGRSTVNSPVQTIVSALAPNGRLSNLYADALNNSRVSADLGSNTSNPSVGGGPASGSGGLTSSSDATKSLLNINVYDIARPQQLSNNYTFVQIPVQLGYQIRPRKRLGFTVLGGLLTNLFVRNTVNNQLSITNTDMVYRPVTLSASTGLRFRYRPTRRWSASMAGIFQQALQRGTRVGADLTTRPQTMGVSVGLDYHF